MTVKTKITAGVAAKMNKNDAFNSFVSHSLDRHLSGDWGEICAEDSAANTANPLYAMSAYTDSEGVKIWIKQDFNIITILFPDKY